MPSRLSFISHDSPGAMLGVGRVDRPSTNKQGLSTKKKGRGKPRLGNDEIRWSILRLLYDQRIASGTRKRYLWSELRGSVRTRLRFTPAEATHNLEYLIQNGWIEKETEPYTGPRSRAFGKERELFGISAKTIDLFEEGSVFSSKPPLQEIVVAGNQNIVQVGPNTFAHVTYGDLQSALLALLQAITLSEELSPEQKIGAIADVKTVQAQLLQPEPDRTVLDKLKVGLSSLANVAGISNFVLTVLRHWPF